MIHLVPPTEHLYAVHQSLFEGRANDATAAWVRGLPEEAHPIVSFSFEIPARVNNEHVVKLLRLVHQYRDQTLAAYERAAANIATFVASFLVVTRDAARGVPRAPIAEPDADLEALAVQRDLFLKTLRTFAARHSLAAANHVTSVSEVIAALQGGAAAATAPRVSWAAPSADYLAREIRQAKLIAGAVSDPTPDSIRARNAAAGIAIPAVLEEHEGGGRDPGGPGGLLGGESQAMLSTLRRAETELHAREASLRAERRRSAREAEAHSAALCGRCEAAHAAEVIPRLEAAFASILRSYGEIQAKYLDAERVILGEISTIVAAKLVPADALTHWNTQEHSLVVRRKANIVQRHHHAIQRLLRETLGDSDLDAVFALAVETPGFFRLSLRQQQETLARETPNITQTLTRIHDMSRDQVRAKLARAGMTMMTLEGRRTIFGIM